MTEREYIEAHQRRMELGDLLDISGREFRRAFPCGWPSIYETHEQSFLSKQVGSAYGTWKVSYNPLDDIYTITHHPEDAKGRIHYVDPDRAHYYRRTADGFYERNELEYRRAS